MFRIALDDLYCPYGYIVSLKGHKSIEFKQ